jgi:2-dehydro-3-deoxyphosphogluconate aldolase/(4S)-4-hydroxy-2-oxoglutarate aldolase
MELDRVLERIESHGVIPVLAVERPSSVSALGEALRAGGLPIAEVTFRTPTAAEVLSVFRRDFPGIVLGAGTVLTPEDAERAKESGAQFLVAPGLNPEVIRAARDLGLPMVPGIQTPSELERALVLGCRVLKIFPAEVAGGVALVKALSGPYGHTEVRFVPTGGVSPANLESYLSVPAVLAVGGTWIARKDDISGGSWDTIRERCREAVGIVGRVRPGGAVKSSES